MCSRVLGEVVVYLNAGAITDLEAKLPLFESFWRCGIHTSNTDCSENVDVSIIDNQGDGQFDLSFCSIKCLTDFFMTIIRGLNSQQKHAARSSDARLSPAVKCESKRQKDKKAGTKIKR